MKKYFNKLGFSSWLIFAMAMIATIFISENLMAQATVSAASGASVWKTLSPYVMPTIITVGSFALTQGIKWLWESALPKLKLPTEVSVAIAGAMGTIIVAVAQTPNINFVVAALLGASAAALHDIVAPPKKSPSLMSPDNK